MSRVELLIIDPQNDFCHPDGALYVVGADQDAERLKAMILRTKDKIDDIHVTLDSHHFMDVAHPIFWIDAHGKHPEPFTVITEDNVIHGVWRTTDPRFQERAINYIRQLRINNRYDLCIWPPHTLIGSWGHNIVQPIYEALIEWEKRMVVVDYVMKGSNFK